LTQDAVELVGEVKENSSAGWEVICGLGYGDVLFKLELHGGDDEVTAAGGSDGIVEC
jgi:hypothetical protein